MKRYKINSERGLARVARELWREIQNKAFEHGVVLALVGELGVGKTRLVKLLAREMGIAEEIHSPTFVLHLTYRGRSGIGLEHVDVWRMEEEKELTEMGVGTLVRPGTVVAIEWAEKVKGVIGNLGSEGRVVWIRIGYSGESDKGRIIEVGGKAG